MRKEIRAEKLHPPIGHYTDAVAHGDLLFLSGCGPTDNDLVVVGGDDVAEQMRQVLANMRTVLEAAGATPQDVVSITTFLTDMDDRAKIAPIAAEFFGTARPASATVSVTGLAVPGAKVEIKAVASIPARS